MLEKKISTNRSYRCRWPSGASSSGTRRTFAARFSTPDRFIFFVILRLIEKRKANQNDTPSTENRETRQQTKSASSAVSRKTCDSKKRAAAVPVTKSVTLVEAAACLHTRFLHCSVCQNKFHQYTETTSVHFGQQEAHSYSNRIKTGSR